MWRMGDYYDRLLLFTVMIPKFSHFWWWFYEKKFRNAAILLISLGIIFMSAWQTSWCIINGRDPMHSEYNANSCRTECIVNTGNKKVEVLPPKSNRKRTSSSLDFPRWHSWRGDYYNYALNMAIISGLPLHPVTIISTRIYFMLFLPKWQKNYQSVGGFFKWVRIR